MIFFLSSRVLIAISMALDIRCQRCCWQRHRQYTICWWRYNVILIMTSRSWAQTDRTTNTQKVDTLYPPFTTFTTIADEHQTRRERGVGGKLPWAREVWGASSLPKNIKCTRMHHFEKKFKTFLPRGLPRKCLGPHKNVSRGPAVALDGPDEHNKQWSSLDNCVW